MTACVKNHSKRVALAISASLVGALTLGAAAPAVAFADDGVQPLFAEGTEFSEGTLNGLSANNYPINDNDGDGVLDITIDKASKLSMRIDADSFTPAGWTGTPFTFNQTDSEFSMRLYHADEDGNPVGAAVSNFTITSAGNYAVVVEALAGSDYAGQVYLTQIEVKGVKLPNVEAFEGVNDGDTTFTYTGSALDVNFKVATGAGDFINAAGEELVEGVDYTVSYTLGGQAVDEVNAAGTYTATLTGLGAYAGSTAQTTIVVNKFIIQSGVRVEVDPFVGEAPTTPSRVYWVDGNGFVTYLDPSLVGVTGTINADGVYTFTATVSNAVAAAGNVELGTGYTADAAYRVANAVNFKYAGADLQDSYELVAADGQTFSTAAITGVYGKTALANSDIVVQRIVKDGVQYSNVANGESDLAAGVVGTYEVTIYALDTAAPYGYGATATFTVTIYADAIDADAQLYVYHGDATAITSYSKLYDGTPVTASDFSVGGNGIDSSKLNVVLTDSEGRVLDQAVDAGEYKLVVTSDYYKLSGTTELPITIEKVDLTALEAENLELWNDIAGQEYLPYTKGDASNRVNTAWSAIKCLGLAVDGETLPENLDIRVQYNDEGEWKTVGSLDDFGAGSYRVIVAVADSAASNYILPEGETSVTIEFTVATRGRFSDVQYSDWCYDAVEKAVANGYMNGYAGTTSFGPWDKLTRGQVAIVLYNMSGASKTWNEGNETNSSYDESKGWVTGFGDVDGHAYYAKAIAWAKSTGVVEGYKDGSGNFGPDDPVTREQFAQMMANYAKVVNRDVTVDQADPASLGEMADGAQVSGWAQKAVAWAVENDVMGSQGSVMPQDTMDRAMCAQMTVNYQPNAKR